MIKTNNQWTRILRKYRYLHELTVEQMAAKIGVSKSTYLALEKAIRSRPSQRTMKELAILLNKDIETLVELYYDANLQK